MQGIYEKYVIQKVDGSPPDPKARYFVLRYDNDEDALYAAIMWAVRKDNWELVEDLQNEVRIVKAATNEDGGSDGQ